jgi:hypothetical protein
MLGLWVCQGGRKLRGIVSDEADELGNSKWKLLAKAETPMQTSYRPELDVSPELESIEASYYQSLIGVLRWITKVEFRQILSKVKMKKDEEPSILFEGGSKPKWGFRCVP